ncbi:MAG: hypothetical protein ABIT38_13955 [Gemmatimonadaceae bacterium]
MKFIRMLSVPHAAHDSVDYDSKWATLTFAVRHPGGAARHCLSCLRVALISPIVATLISLRGGSATGAAFGAQSTANGLGQTSIRSARTWYPALTIASAIAAGLAMDAS